MPARHLTAARAAPAAEALVLAAAAAAWGAAVVPPAQLPATALLGTALGFLALDDLRRFRLPDRLTLPLAAAGLAVAATLPEPALAGHVIGAALGFALLVVVTSCHRLITGRDGLGGGDAKLLAAGGAWLGWQALPALLLLSATGGIAWALAGAVRRGPAAPIPYGVPLAAAIWLLWLYGVPGG